MRDIYLAQIDPRTGLATFSIVNIQPAYGIKLLVSKVSKYILSSTFKTNMFSYVGLDLDDLAQMNVANSSVDEVKASLSSKLNNIESSVQRATSSLALSTERLASLTLNNLLYDQDTNSVLMEIEIQPVEGDSQIMIYPISV